MLVFQGGKTFRASLIACVCLFRSVRVLTETEWNTRVANVCSLQRLFFVFDVVVAIFSSLENYFGFRTTNVRVKTDHPSVWGGIKRFEHFQRGLYFSDNRPVALRGQVTNASFKRWVGILLMPKIDRAHKNYLTPEIWEETHLREIFYGTLIFQQSSMICIGLHVGGHILALHHGGQNYFLLISC